MSTKYSHIQGKNQNVIEEFSKRLKKQFLVSIPLGIIAVFFIVLKNFNENPEIAEIAPKVGFGFVVALLIFSFFNWRCPACNKYLGKGGAPVYCPKCGAQLKEEK